MGLVTLYALLKCFIFKLPVHIIWNVVMLICILTLVIGALLGIVSFIFGAVSPVLAYVLEPEFLKTFGAVGGAETYVDVCLNGDGDLATKMNISATLAPNIERFNNISRVVETFSSALLNESLVYKNLLTAVDGYQNDLRTTTTAAIHGDNDITTLLNKINAITDTPACGHDYYVTNEAQCNEKSGYTKITTSGTPFSANNNCILITIKHNTYTCSTVGMPDLQTTQKYVNDIDGALTKTKNTLTEAQTRCNTLIGNIRTQYGITGRMANSMTGVVEDAVGPDSTLFSMFNCNYLGYDLIQFVNQFHNKFTKSCRDIGISCLCGCFFSYNGGYILLRAMYHYSPQAKKNAEGEHLPSTNRVEAEMVQIKTK